MEPVKLKLAWSYMSLFVGFCLMFVVNLELLLQMLVKILGGSNVIRPIEGE